MKKFSFFWKKKCMKMCNLEYFVLPFVYIGVLHSQSFPPNSGPGWLNELRQLDYLATRTILSPIPRGFAPGFVNYKKGCTRLATASDEVYQLLAHGRWFSPGTLASSTTKTGRHDIAEILLKVALNTKIQIEIQNFPPNSHQTLPIHLFQKQI